LGVHSCALWGLLDNNPSRGNGGVSDSSNAGGSRGADSALASDFETAWARLTVEKCGPSRRLLALVKSALVPA
jgi:hypothetical protein